ncbi:MAG: Winged helix DNA-binding protein [Mucilaginibacter sp.]|nr:Winged helix DNA-binding protein [Mucilaginibacter sp.]
MIELTAPRINAFCASMFRQLQLDSVVFKRSNDALAKALEGNKQLNRLEVMSVLNEAGVATDDLRFIHLLMRAELDRIICSGARQGKQFTYALFDDRVPNNTLPKEESLAELALRYFISHGPATLQDFTWWSGLAANDTKIGLEIVKPELAKVMVDGREYWMVPNEPITNSKAPIAYLLPAFDEFAVAYKDRTATVNPKYLEQARHVIFDPSIVVNNQVIGTWKRIIKNPKIDITLNTLGNLNKIQTKAVERAKKRYLKFMEF